MMGSNAIRRRKPGWPSGFFAPVLGLLLVVYAAGSCSRHEDLAGRYEAFSRTADGQIIHTLELQTDGKGFWSVDSDNAPLRWDVHKKTVRLHTPAGGVVQGEMDPDGLRITLPGQGVIQFKKVR